MTDEHYTTKWSRCLQTRVGWLFNQLGGRADVGAAYFKTRQERYPDFVDKRASRTFSGDSLPYCLKLQETGMRHHYNNDDMFNLVIIDAYTKAYYYISVNAYIFSDINYLYPDMIQVLHYSETDAGSQDEIREIIWTWIQCCVWTKEAEERSSLMKEELMAATWHPKRVSKRLSAGLAFDDM